MTRVVHVKSVYAQGTMLKKTSREGRSSNYYTFSDPCIICGQGLSNSGKGTFFISVDVSRVNDYGYGVDRLDNPHMKAVMTIGDNTDDTAENKEITRDFPVSISDKCRVVMDVEKCITSVDYGFVRVLPGREVRSGESHSAIKHIYADGKDGFIRIGCLNAIITALKDYNDDQSKWNVINYIFVDYANIRYNAEGNSFAETTSPSKAWTNKKKNLLAPMQTALEQYGDITYYMLQWAIINNYEVLDPVTAETRCKEAYAWCREEEQSNEEV